MTGQLDDISRRLEKIAEELGDMIIAHLRESLDVGDRRSTSYEKRVSRARRAVEKAAAILAETED